MGVLPELFSKPIYGPNGEMGDVAVERAVPYSEESEREALANKRRGTVRQAQQRFVGRRAAMPPEEAALLLAQTLQQHGPLTRKVLGQKTRLFGSAFDAAAAHGKLQREDRSAHANGGGPSTQVWSLPPEPEQQYQRRRPTNYADQYTLDTLLAQLAAAEMGPHRWGRDNPINGLRGILADAMDDMERAGPEAALLRQPGQHVMVTPEGVRPGRFTGGLAHRASVDLDRYVDAFLIGAVPEYTLLDEAARNRLIADQYGGIYFPDENGANDPMASPIPPGYVRIFDPYPPMEGLWPNGFIGNDIHVSNLPGLLHELHHNNAELFSEGWGDHPDAEHDRLLEAVRTAPFEEEDPDYAPPAQQYRRTTNGTPYHWMHAPPGGPHMLNGRPYRTGQFVPGTTMFTHTPRRPQDRQEAINPEAPLMYDPQYYGPSPMGPSGAQQQQDGTHALPMPANPGAPVQGAPQTVGGEPLAMPGQGAAQGPNDLPPPQSPGMAPGSPPGQQAPGIPQPVPQGPQPLRTPGLSPQDAVLEAQSQMFAWTNFGALRDAYFTQNAKLDPVSGDVRSLVLNSDQWNAYIPGFTGQNAGAVHQAAAWLNDQLFRESLQNQAGKGNNKMLIVSGAAAGEGTKDFLEASEYPLVLEQPSRDYNKVADQFERARAAGMEPSFQYVDRPASENAAESIEQALQDRLAGRPAKTQPLEALARTNIDARRVALEVLFRNPDVETAVVDHHGGERFTRRMITDRGQAAMYLARRLAEDERDMPAELEKTKQDLIRRQKAGEIPADLVTGWLGAGWHIRSPAPVQPRRWY